MAPPRALDSPDQRFWRRVIKTNNCWLWKGSRDSDGYGIWTFGGHWDRGLHRAVGWRTVRAHRYAYQLIRGSIPPKLLVCHQCNVKNCVNPAHLYLGTNSDNMKDSYRAGHSPAGRGLQGELNGRAKLTWYSVAEIRHNVGESIPVLALRFGVSNRTITGVLAGQTWTKPEIPLVGRRRKRPRRRTALERFEAKVEPEPNSGCWLWIGARSTWGYGAINSKLDRNVAHRTSYRLFVGPVPPGFVVHHRCGVRTCVNPAHLLPVSKSENWRAMPEVQRTALIRIALAARWSKKVELSCPVV